MLLIVSNTQDLHSDVVVLECAARGAPVLRLNTEQYPARIGLDLRLNGASWSGTLRVPGRAAVSLDQIQSVWYRRPELPSVDHLAPADRELVREEASTALGMLYQALEDRFWMSWPPALRAAQQKGGQLVRASRLGLATPRSLVTSDPHEIVALLAEHGPRGVVKRLGAITGLNEAIYTTPIDRDTIRGSEAEIAVCPVLVQEYVPKAVEIRAVVVDETVLAAEIHSQTNERTRHDLRRQDLLRTPHRRHALPDRIAAALVSLTRSYGLTFSAADLILTPEGEYVFLDLNPNGQWGWIESLTGLPIAATLTERLLRGHRASE